MPVSRDAVTWFRQFPNGASGGAQAMATSFADFMASSEEHICREMAPAAVAASGANRV
jgi:hypothetical protein